jgi:restriction system protein
VSAKVPSQRELLVPSLEALRALGGRATGMQLTQKVIADFNFQSLQAALAIEEPGRSKTRLEERLSWCRSRLKAYGVADNPVKGLWDLTEFGWTVGPDDIPGLVKARNDEYRKRRRERRAASKPVERTEATTDLFSDRLQKMEEWIEWSRGELGALASRIADLEEKVAEPGG